MPAVNQHHYAESDHQCLHEGRNNCSLPKLSAEPGFVPSLPYQGDSDHAGSCGLIPIREDHDPDQKHPAVTTSTPHQFMVQCSTRGEAALNRADWLTQWGAIKVPECGSSRSASTYRWKTQITSREVVSLRA